MDDTQLTGQSNPPNGGQVSDVTNTEPNDQQPPVNQTPSAVQPTPGQPTSMIPLKAPQGMPQGPQPQAPQPQPHPAIQRASMLNGIAEALSGGPHYKPVTDVNTGTVKMEKVPLKGSQIGLAIALEAISGGLAGLAGGRGNNFGGAAGAGLKQGEQIAQQQQAQEQQKLEEARQSNSDAYTRQAAITNTNFQTYQNQLKLSQMDHDMNQQDVESHKPIYDELQQLGAVKDIINDTPEDLAKFHVTRDMAVPVETVPRIGPDGKQVTNSYGVPLWNKRLAIIDPNKIMNIPEDTLKTLQSHHVPGYSNSDGSPINIPKDAQLRAHFVLGAMQKAQAIDLIEHQLNEWTKGTPVTGGSTGGSVWTLFKGEDGKADLGKLADAMANVESGGKEDARSVRNNNPGNLKATSPDQKQDKDGFRIFDNKDEGKQAQLGQLSRDMQRYPDASPEQYLGEHYSAGDPENVIKNYADSLRKASGNPDHAPVPVAPQVNLADQIAKNPAIANLLPVFQKYGTAGIANGAMQKDEEAGKVPPGTTGIFKQMMGGDDSIQTHNDLVAAHRSSLVDAAKDTEKLNYNESKRKQDEAGILERNSNMIDAMASGKNIDFSRIATMRAYDREIINNEVLRRNPNFNLNSVERAVKLADEAADVDKTGTIGNSIKNTNTAFGHMGQALTSLNEIGKTEGRTFSDYTNKPQSWLDNHFANDPNYQTFKTELNAAATDWQNLLNNQHALHDSDKKLIETIADPNAPLANIVAAIHGMARTGAIRTVPLNEEWQQTMGVPHPNLIQPQTIDALKVINDPVVNKLFSGLQSGGMLTGGEKGVGSPGKNVGDLIGQGNQAPPQYKVMSASGNYGWNESTNQWEPIKKK